MDAEVDRVAADDRGDRPWRRHASVGPSRIALRFSSAAFRFEPFQVDLVVAHVAERLPDGGVHVGDRVGASSVRLAGTRDARPAATAAR